MGGLSPFCSVSANTPISSEHRANVMVATQTITFSAIPAQIVGRKDFDPGAVASSGLPVTYSSNNTAVATIVDNKVHIVGIGSVTITASQVGNGVFSAAPNATSTFAVSNLTITAPSTTISGSDVPIVVNAVSPASIVFSTNNPAVATIVNNQLRYTGLGQVKITATQPADLLFNETVAEVTINVATKANQTISFPAIAANQILGRKDFDPAATASSGLPVTYSSGNTAVATIVDDKIRIVGVGSAVITASQVGDARYNVGTSTQTLSVVALTVPALGAKTFTTTDFSLTTYNAPANIIYESSDPAVATVVNNKIHYVGLGSTTITARQAENSQFNAVTSPGVLLTVTQSTAHTLTFAALGNRAFTTTDLDPGATSSLIDKNLYPITYTVPTNNFISIVDNKIRFKAVGGPVTITATQTGDSKFTTKTATATITVTAPTITLPAFTSKVVGATDVDLAATTTSTISQAIVPITFTSSNPNAVLVYQKTKLRFVGTGSATITATQAATATTPAASATSAANAQAVTAAVITFNAPAAQLFSDVDFTPVATSTFPTATAPIIFSSSDETKAVIVNGKIRFVAPGTVNITASQPVPVPFVTAPVAVTRALTINPSAITFGSLGSKFFTDVDFTLTATSSISSVPITYTSSDPAVVSIVDGNKLRYVEKVSAPKTVTITASQAGTGVADVSQVLEVLPPQLTFPALGSKPIYPIDFTLNATSTLTLTPITYTSSDPTVARVSGSSLKLLSVGQAVITASQPGSGVADFSQTITVTPAVTGVITFANKTQALSIPDIAHGATSTRSVADFPLSFVSDNPAVAKVENLNGTWVVRAQGVGVANITANQAGSISKSAVFTITPPTLTIAANRTLPFGTAPVAPAATASFPFAPIVYTSSNPEVAVIENDMIRMVGMGVTQIRASQSSALSSFNQPADAIQVLIVDRPLITFTPASIVRPFSAIDIAPTASTGTAANPTNTAIVLNSTMTDVPLTFTSSNPNVVTIVNDKLHFEGFGSTIITAFQAGKPGILPAFPKEQILTVNVKMLPTSATYGDADINPGVALGGIPVTYTSANQALANTLLDPTKIRIVQAGTVNITAGNLVGDLTNPATATVTAALTINKAPLTVKVKDYTRYFGEEDPLPTLWDLEYTGFTKAFGTTTLDDESVIITKPSTSNNKLIVDANNLDLILSSTGKHILKPGVYLNALTASGGNSTNYAFNFQPGTLTVLPKPQALSFDPLNTRTYGDIDFDPLAVSTGDAVVYTSSNTAVATIVNGKVHIVGAGTTDITASVGTPSGYFSGTPAPITRQLVVNKAAQTITLTDVPVLKVGDKVTLDAQASSGQPVVYTLANSRPVALNGTVLSGVKIGESSVIITQAGDANYLSAEIKVPVKVEDAAGELVSFTQAVTPNGDGKNDFLIIDGLANYPKNRVTIINNNGTKVFKSENYNNADKVFAGKSSSGGDFLPEGTYYCIIEYKVSNNWEKKTGYLVLKY